MSSSAIRSLPRTLTPGTWVLDPEQSSVKFMVLSMPPAWGRFTELEGSLEVGEDALANGRGQIAASSIRTGFPPRDAHLRSSHFFDVKRHPRITAAVSLAENTSGQASVDVALSARPHAVPFELFDWRDGLGSAPAVVRPLPTARATTTRRRRGG